jgi:benzoylformate decarboxylase
VSETGTVNAAEAFVAQLVAGGVRVVFGNPGTTEYAVLDAIDDRDDIELVLALHEGVAVSSAIGYARATGEVGVVELHAAPGLGNGMGMMYDAWAGNTPLLVYVGQTEHSVNYLEPLLSGELAAMAGPVTKWAYEIRTPDEVPTVVRRALKVALTPPCGPVMLSLPMDISEHPCRAPVEEPSRVPARTIPDPAAVNAAADLILAAQAPIIVPGDSAARAGAVGEISRLAHLTGSPIRGGFLFETAISDGDPLGAERLNHAGPETKSVLAEHDLVVAVGGKLFRQLFPEAGDQVGPARVVHIGSDPWELGKNHPSTMVYGDERLTVAALVRALEERADAEQKDIWAKRREVAIRKIELARSAALGRDRTSWDSDPMTPARAAFEIASGLPEDVCVSDESLTTSAAVARYLTLRPGNWYRGRGGGIGEGLPMALGIKLARPDQPVVGLVSDGAALYAPTALWTAAHHRIPVVWIVLNNRAYRILKENAARRRPDSDAGRPSLGTDLDDPPVDFVELSRSFGVSAERVTDPGLLADAVRRAFATNQPALIDVIIA